MCSPRSSLPFGNDQSSYFGRCTTSTWSLERTITPAAVMTGMALVSHQCAPPIESVCADQASRCARHCPCRAARRSGVGGVRRVVAPHGVRAGVLVAAGLDSAGDLDRLGGAARRARLAVHPGADRSRSDHLLAALLGLRDQTGHGILAARRAVGAEGSRSEEHTSEIQSLM